MPQALRRRHILSIPLGLVLVGACLWVQQTRVPAVREVRNRLEGLAYDVRFDPTQPLRRGR